MPKSSVADCMILNLDCKVSSISVAIACPAPLALSNCVAKSPIVPVPSSKILNAETALLSTSFSMSSVGIPESFNSCKAFSRSSTLSIPVPSSFDNFDEEFVRSSIIVLKAVPAIEPLIPALASVPKIAVVSSKENPATLATGATNDIELENLSMSKAVEAKLVAITSVSLVVSLASKPKALSVEPATLADCPKSRPKAVERFRVPSVTSKISSAVNPNLENSI